MKLVLEALCLAPLRYIVLVCIPCLGTTSRSTLVLDMIYLFIFGQIIRVLSRFVYTRKMLLSHTTPRLIFMQIGRDHKGGKALSQNTTVFPELELELETTG